MQDTTNTTINEPMMRRALELAMRGAGNVSPNPLVGCVIVGRDGSVIGEGAHLKFGEAHAEVNAVRDAESRGHSLEGSTVYVNLEPCSHYGKTPPCADLLVEKRVARVVIAMTDPNPKVSGQGIGKLSAAGIEIVNGVLKTEALDLNRFFVKHVTTGMPYVTVKMAITVDGRTALENGESQWITSPASRREVHRMRATHDAVLVGSGTVLYDDPALTVRDVEGRNPVRIVIAGMYLPREAKVYSDEHRSQTWVVSSNYQVRQNPSLKAEVEELGMTFIQTKSVGHLVNLTEMLRMVGEKGITSVLVESGSRIVTSLLSEDAIDELVFFVGPRLFGNSPRGVLTFGYDKIDEAPKLSLLSATRVQDSDDLMLRYKLVPSTEQP